MYVCRSIFLSPSFVRATKDTFSLSFNPSLPPFSFLPAVYAPEDRQQFIDTVVGMIFRENNVRITMLMRMSEHDGTSKLCLQSLLTFQEAGMHGLIFKTESKCEGGKEGRRDGGQGS